MIENVRGLLDKRFDEYRKSILDKLSSLGYSTHIQLLNASDYGVPQLRPRVIIIGVSCFIHDTFTYPEPEQSDTNNVGDAIIDLVSKNGWEQANSWYEKAKYVAPTIVGGSKKHGGPDLGPTRARKAWAELGIDGKGVADDAPSKDHEGPFRLTSRMIARIQGFPDNWDFGRKKTLACRMIGNAFPPPVAMKIGQQIIKVLNYELTYSKSKKELSQQLAE